MRPRLDSSKKWTNFPQEYQQKILEVFNEAFSKSLGDSRLKIEGRFYPSELFLAVGLIPKNSIRQNNFIVSLDFNSEKENAIKRIEVAIDCAAAMLDQFLTNGQDNTEFPVSWEKTEFKKETVHIMFSPENTDLESQANALLNITPPSDSLIKGEDLEEELDTLKKTIGIDDFDEN